MIPYFVASEAVDVAAQPRWCLNVYRISRHKTKRSNFIYMIAFLSLSKEEF